MENPIQDTATLEKPRRRLLRAHRRFGSWRRLAEDLGVNVYYVHQFAVHGKVPANRLVQHALGIKIRRRRTLADIDRDMKLPISEMPDDALRAAFMFREVM